MWQSTMFAIAGFCGILVILKLTFPYLAPFLIGLLCAVILDGPVTFLQARGWPRSLAALIAVVAFFLTLPLVLSMFLIQFWREAQALLQTGAFPAWPDLFSRLPFDAQFTSGDVLTLIIRVVKHVLAVPDLVVIWILAALSAYFFCRDKRQFTRFVTGLLPLRWKQKFLPLYRNTSSALGGLIKVQLLLIFSSAAVSTAAFYLLGLSFPLLLGFLVGFFDLMPILGPGLVYVSLAGFQLWRGNISAALALGLTYLLLLLVRQLIEPKLIGERLGLHPLTALLGLYVGLRFWGLLGALAGPIIMVLLKALIVINHSQ